MRQLQKMHYQQNLSPFRSSLKSNLNHCYLIGISAQWVPYAQSLISYLAHTFLSVCLGLYRDGLSLHFILTRLQPWTPLFKPWSLASKRKCEHFPRSSTLSQNSNASFVEHLYPSRLYLLRYSLPNSGPAPRRPLTKALTYPFKDHRHELACAELYRLFTALVSHT